MTQSGNSPRKATPAQQDYAWLERTRQVFQQLEHNPDSAALQGIISEGQARLGKVTPEDEYLAGFLRLAVAEAQIKLGLELDDTQDRREAFASGRENCEKIALAAQESSCGVACILLPRVITLLAALYKASDELRTPPALADSLQSIASQLDDALLQQAYLRHKALEKLHSARLLATTLESLSPEDRRQLLVQVANQMLEAGENYLESGDEEMVAQVQTDLVAIQNALNDPTLPIPSLALFKTPLDEREWKTEGAEEEPVQVKPFVAAQATPPQPTRRVQPSKRQRTSPLRWVISIGGLMVSCLTILCSGASLYTGWANRAAANGEETTLHLTQTAFAVQMTAGAPATIPLATGQWIEPTPPIEMPTPPASSAISCPGAPASRLQIGDQASVGNVGGYSLTIYEAPGYQSTELYYLEEGDFLSIIGGPVCIQNQYWWEINLDQGHTGWAPESSETGAYLLIP